MIFIIGVDKKILEKSVIAKYGTDLIDGNKYLEKIINLSFPLPDPKINQVDFISSLFNEYIAKYDDEYKSIETRLKSIANSLELKNPRRLRKVVMRLTFYLIFREGESSKNIFSGLLPEVIIFMILFKEFYPEAYNLSKVHKQIFYNPEKVEKKTGRVLSFSEISDNSCKEWAEIICHKHHIESFKTDYIINATPKEQANKKIDTIIRQQPQYFKAIDFLYTLSQ